MSFEAVFENKEVQDFVDNLDKKLSKVKDGKTQYATLISALVFQDVMDHFKKEEGSGGAWKEWSTSYKDYMNEIGKGGNNLLQDTGKLRSNFTKTDWKSSKEGIFWFNNAKTSGGFPYAFAHDEGGKKLPKRDFMWLSKKALDKIAEQTLQFMMEKGI